MGAFGADGEKLVTLSGEEHRLIADVTGNHPAARNARQRHAQGQIRARHRDALSIALTSRTRPNLRDFGRTMLEKVPPIRSQAEMRGGP